MAAQAAYILHIYPEATLNIVMIDRLKTTPGLIPTTRGGSHYDRKAWRAPQAHNTSLVRRSTGEYYIEVVYSITVLLLCKMDKLQVEVLVDGMA